MRTSRLQIAAGIFKHAPIWCLLCGVSLLLGGCAVGPNYRPPHISPEKTFGELQKTNPLPSRATADAPVTDWWRTFNDDRLNRLITDALQRNYNLQIAAERIRESRFQRGIIAADLFPNLDADGGYLRARGSKNVALPLGGGAGGSSAGKSSTTKSAGAAGTDPPGDPPSSAGGSGSGASQTGGGPSANQLTPLGKGGLPGVETSLYQIGFDSNWELDFFGGTQRRLEAASAELAASLEMFRDVRVTLLAEVARNYLELRGTQQRLAVARENLAAQKELLNLTVSRASSGLTSQADVLRASAQAATTAATIPPLEARVRRSIHALSTLLAEEPTALSAELEDENSLPVTPPEVPVGLPSDLLKRRPDIRRAERELAAATARIGNAQADLFPKFALTGGVGLDSTSSGNLFDWSSHYFFISPTVTWRVFDAGRIVSNIALQKAIRRESLLQYRNTISMALRELEDALVSYASEQEHRAALAEALRQNQDSLDLTRNRYEHGLTNFLDVLDAERNVFAAQDQLAQSDEAVATDLVALYKSLGGAWGPPATVGVNTR